MTKITNMNRNKYKIDEWVLEELHKKNLSLFINSGEFNIKHNITGSLKNFEDLTTLENYANCLCFN